jgi:holo-[acyl-carrier protein] synthase
VDIVDINDFSRLMDALFIPYLDRSFTAGEIAAAGGGKTRTEKLASRFAIKEAVLKALGVGWGNGVAFTDVEVVTLDTGAPTVFLYRRLAQMEKELGICAWLVSASHTSSVAVGSALALGK